MRSNPCCGSASFRTGRLPVAPVRLPACVRRRWRRNRRSSRSSSLAARRSWKPWNATSAPAQESELLDFILEDIPALKRLISDPLSSRAITTAMDAAAWLDEHLEDWLGEEAATDKLSLSVAGNVTSEMGLELLDLADVIRPHPQVVAALERADGEDPFDALEDVPGGREARDAIRGYLERYGMRCAGEIDITRPRWSESSGHARARDPLERQELRAWRRAAPLRAGPA